MALSEHEQRLLEQMERALYAEDPKFATSLRGANGRGGNRSRAALGVVVVLAGIAMLMIGVIVQGALPVGMVGFVVMLLGALLAYSALRAAPATEGIQAPEGKGGRRAATAKPSGADGAGFMGRLEDRWRRRRDGDLS